MSTTWNYKLASPPRITSDANFSNIMSSEQSKFQSIVTVPTPTLETGAANKNYVDTHGGGGTPGGNNTEVQYNNNGLFGGSSDFVWDNTLKKLTVNGNIIAQNHLSTSDIMLKSNISELDNCQSLELLSKIECYKYNLLDSDQETYGVIAQQLEEIGLNNLVNKGSDYKSVAYTQLVPLIIASLKQLNKKVENNHVPFKPLEQPISFKPFKPLEQLIFKSGPSEPNPGPSEPGPFFKPFPSEPGPGSSELTKLIRSKRRSGNKNKKN